KHTVGIGGENTGSSILADGGLTELVLGSHASQFVDGRFAKGGGTKKTLTGIEIPTREAIEVNKPVVCPAPSTPINCQPPVSDDLAAVCGEDRAWIHAKCQGVSYLD